MTFFFPQCTVAFLQRADSSSFVNQISTNVDQNLRLVCVRSKAGGVEEMVPQR